MTTIMTQTNSEGTHRCDAKCHNAVGEKCTCICGGRYHGAARNGTLKALVEERLEQLRHEYKGLESFFGQLRLFPEEEKTSG